MRKPCLRSSMRRRSAISPVARSPNSAPGPGHDGAAGHLLSSRAPLNGWLPGGRKWTLPSLVSLAPCWGLLGAAAQRVQASRSRHWQQADLPRTVKRGVYAEYVRSISASYGQRSCTEDASLLAATAEIEILSGREVRVPARELTDTVIGVHAKIAAGGGAPEPEVADADRRRLQLIELFKADLGLPAHAIVDGPEARRRPEQRGCEIPFASEHRNAYQPFCPAPKLVTT